MIIAEQNAVASVVNRYAHAIDDGDIEKVLVCFESDARIEYNDGAVALSGHGELAAFLATSLVGASTHLFSPPLVERSGDAVIAQVSALVCKACDPAFVTVRGVKYRFTFRGEGESWTITHLLHRPQWAFSVPATASSLGNDPKSTASGERK